MCIPPCVIKSCAPAPSAALSADAHEAHAFRAFPEIGMDEDKRHGAVNARVVRVRADDYDAEGFQPASRVPARDDPQPPRVLQPFVQRPVRVGREVVEGCGNVVPVKACHKLHFCAKPRVERFYPVV